MRKSARNGAFDRPKNGRPRKMTKRGLASLAALATLATLPVIALAAPEIASPVTQYDRQMAQSSDAGQKPGSQQGGRIEPWERLDMTQEVDAIQGLDAEIGSSGVSTQDAQADHLFNRMKDDPEWLTLKGQVDNYANREEDLEFRVDRLENLDYNWEPAGTLASGWNLLGATPTGSWSPAINNQKTNFTQTIDRVLSYNKKLEEQERNIVTGEIKTVKESYITKTENDTISRNINVALGSWANVGGLYGCTTWSPATSTKPQGTKFTQSRTCKQDQQQNVSYTVASTGENPGGAWTDTRTIDKNRTRSATGTKVVAPVEECYQTQRSVSPTHQNGRDYSIFTHGGVGMVTQILYWKGVKKGEKSYPHYYETEYEIQIDKGRPIKHSDGYNYWGVDSPSSVSICRIKR